MLNYELLKWTHVTAVIVSGSLFFLRGVWMVFESPRLQLLWVRVLPHVVDTILLLSAIGLTLVIQQYPITHGWLTAKVIALLVYIGLGTVALRRGRTRRAKLGAWIAALAVFGYIVAVALTRRPLPLPFG